MSQSVLANYSISQINTWPHGFGRFRDLVLPIKLSIAFHQQEAAAFQNDTCLEGLILFMAKLESSRCAKTDRSDDRTGAQGGFIISVPADTLLARAIEIHKDRVKLDTGTLFDTCFERAQAGGPGCWLHGQPGIGIGCTRFAIPGGEARLCHFSLKESELILSPRALTEQLREELIAFLAGKKDRIISDITIRQSQMGGCC